MFAKSEEEARSKIQDYLDDNIDGVETLSVEEVDSFFSKEPNLASQKPI